jgi:nucleotide-binding universal stress UspA family protein
MASVTRIVAATDFSEPSQRAVRLAAALASGSPAELHLVHVVPVLHPPATVDEARIVDFDALRRRWIEHARRQLAAVADQEAGRGLAVRQVVLTGALAESIARYAAEQHADLVVVGTHGHGRVMRVLLGSVAEHLVRQATCPVLIVPEADDVDRDERAAGDAPSEQLIGAPEGEVDPLC